MSHTLCFETICVEHRTLKNLSYHEARLNKTRRDLMGFEDHWNLTELLAVPESIDNTLHKCRVSYGEEIEEIKWEPYSIRTIRKVQRVYHDNIDYRFKYENRDELNALFAQRKDADEILIIKNGFVTDSLYCNVAFFDGNVWHTPSSPLLPGTQRAFLLDSEVIREADIRESDLRKFSRVKLFNAMLDWENAVELDIGCIA
ncbi:aminotransferase class IV family protein [Dyadobacter sp. CY326]|uniref:aminotransferase class IV family protein n=1 Tax=Dyadobacter sp. CY326 TaxID=2907300 RepID=UPI001F3AEFBF|nr:aminotransferase class IV family protein [Dyadobacter sp. CY326]MCE7068087.1 aminotransferase class IV family protein [Dyadobacter sp. CY326]